MKKNILGLYLIAAITGSSCSLSERINRTANRCLIKDDDFIHAHTGISIYEPATKKYWYDYQGDKYFTPASNTKLATCYAAMKYLGDSLIGLRYELINDSTVMIKGMGDPTFLHPDYDNNPVFNFLSGFREVRMLRSGFTDYLGDGWGWNDYMDDYMAQRSSLPIYGNTARIKWNPDGSLNIMPGWFRTQSVVKQELKGGFRVTKAWDSNHLIFHQGKDKFREIPFRPDGNTIEALLRDTLHLRLTMTDDYTGNLNEVIYSQPTDSLLKVMMHRSDNFFAEQTLLMVSQQLLGHMNDRKIIDTLLKTDYSDMPQKPGWVDGSGLSRYDLFSPKDFIFILNKMKEDFGMQRIEEILPTGGTGTISKYYAKDSGFIFVKTGTLNGVVALSGYLYTKKNKMLLFSVLVNNHRSSPAKIRKAIEKFIQDIRDKY